jgi:hypothetical protein
MKRISRIAAWSSLTAFILFTLWRGIVHGVMEQPSFEVSHLDAGAGDSGLLVQFVLAIFTLVFVAFWFFTESRSKGRIAPFAMAAVIPALFLVCARGLQRFAPQYSEAGFQQLIASQQSGKSLRKEDVVGVLGDALIQRTRAAARRGYIHICLLADSAGTRSMSVWMEQAESPIFLQSVSLKGLFGAEQDLANFGTEVFVQVECGLLSGRDEEETVQPG